MNATPSTSTYSAKKRILYGVTTGGLLIGGIGMASAQAATSGTSATGVAAGSPGILSGNLIEIPVNLPVNLCGNTLNVVGLLNPAADNTCGNENGSGGSGGSTTATGAALGSPGIASGNLISAPINAPVNICGNSVNVVGIGNPAAGNTCGNENGAGDGGDSGGSTTATGTAAGSPGIGSGNSIGVPIDVPVNVCGNSVSVVGIGNSTFGNTCGNEGHDTPTPPPGCGCAPTPPPVTTPPTGANTGPVGQLASTGTGAMGAAPIGFGLLGTGTYLRRRGVLKSRA